MACKTVLITGIFGQDGAYLAQIALRENYRVIGAGRHTDQPQKKWRLQHLGISDAIEYRELNLADTQSVQKLMEENSPDLIFNMAAQSSVAESFKKPFETLDSTLMGAARIFEAARIFAPQARIFQPLSSQKMPTSSPYAAAKVCASILVDLYRERYGLFISSAVLHNHESPLRNTTFVSKKIVHSLVKICQGTQKTLALGNLDSQRYWSHARDIMEGAWKSLQQSSPNRYVLTSDQIFSVREFATQCAAQLGIKLSWHGTGKNETGLSQDGTLIVWVDPSFYRPTDPVPDRSGALETEHDLHWKTEVPLADLIQEMIDFEFTPLNSETAPNLA